MKMVHPMRQIFFGLIMAASAFATPDEYWGIYQVRKNLSDSHFVFAEYVRRDIDGYFDQKSLDLVRLSYGGKWQDWIYLLGVAYVDFNQKSDERRAHQFFIRSYQHSPQVQSLMRIGLEERSFINDQALYLRARIRGQLNFFTQSPLGLSVYDEAFFAMNGPRRFYQGLNENRLGLGIHLKISQAEFFVYQTYAHLKTTQKELNQEWIQFQMIVVF